MTIRILAAAFVLSCVASAWLSAETPLSGAPRDLLKQFVESDLERIKAGRFLSTLMQQESLPNPAVLLVDLERYLDHTDPDRQVRAVLALATVVLEYRVRIAAPADWQPVDSQVRRLIPKVAQICTAALAWSARHCLPALVDLLLCVDRLGDLETEAVAGALNAGLQSEDEALRIVALGLSEVFQTRYGDGQ